MHIERQHPNRVRVPWEDRIGDSMASRGESDREPARRRSLLFEYPALPKWEFRLYLSILIGSLSYGWYKVFEASRTYEWNTHGNYESVTFDGHTYRKDTTETEWAFWCMYIRRAILWFLGHSLLFNLGELLLPVRIWRPLMLAYWIVAHIAITNGKAVTLCVGLAVYTLARLTRSKVVAWTGAMLLFYWTESTDLFRIHDPTAYGFYVSASIFPYKTVQYLTFITEMLDARRSRVASNGDKPKDTTTTPKGLLDDEWTFDFVTGMYEMFWYSFYMPYSCQVIVTYKRFPAQMAARSSRQREWPGIVSFAARILFWYVLANGMLYAFYFEAMMQNPDYLRTIRKDILCAIGYATGQFFHLKYVVIFGLTSVFARLDRMQPFQPPICITRVALYSKMWRCFDRGLYDFFKEYIFLPICRPTFSIGRKIVGVLISFAFVLFWHGTTSQYVVWILLNISELFMEIVAKLFYSIPIVRTTRERYVSDRNFRRLLAWIQILPLTFGLFSTFYFLGNSQSGYVFVERIFWEEIVPVKWPFIALLCLGYCYSHVCMEVDRWQGHGSTVTDASGRREKDR